MRGHNSQMLCRIQACASLVPQIGQAEVLHHQASGGGSKLTPILLSGVKCDPQGILEFSNSFLKGLPNGVYGVCLNPHRRWPQHLHNRSLFRQISQARQLVVVLVTTEKYLQE